MGVKEKLIKLMSEKGFNASTLAEQAKLPKSTVYAILKRDSSNLSYQTAQKLADALGCNVFDILEISKDSRSQIEILKNKISGLNRLLKELSEDKVLFEGIDDQGETFEYYESIYAAEIQDINIELLHLNSKIAKILERSGISLEPSTAPEIMNFYNELNEDGKLEAVKRVEELTQIPKYKK